MKSNKMKLSITFLGQVCILINYDDINVLIDPYFSNYVGDQYGEDFNRQQPVVELAGISPDIVCVTHDHEDHCDPITLGNIRDLFPDTLLICNKSSSEILSEKQIIFQRIEIPKPGEKLDFKNIKITTIPSAHLEYEIDAQGYSKFNGYLFDIDGYIIYHPGDTIPHKEIFQHLPEQIDLAFLPINERNYFRDEKNIIGNMTCREAIQFADVIGAKRWIPTHWDMFKYNSVEKEELNVAAKILGKEDKISWMDFNQKIEIDI